MAPAVPDSRRGGRGLPILLAASKKLHAIALMQRGGCGLDSRFSGEGCGDVVEPAESTHPPR
jgi:hypothetical protein